MIEYVSNPVYQSLNDTKSESHSQISDNNEQDGCDSHSCRFQL